MAKKISVLIKQKADYCVFNSDESWTILSPIEQSIKAKIEKVGTPLKDWNINIYRGVLTGYNDAFIINGDKKNEILENCKSENERNKTAEIIRPILRGRDIKRYSYDFANLYLICTFPSLSLDIDEYPAVKDYLLSFGKERLEQTGKTHNVDGKIIKSRKKTNNKWFETQDSIGYWEDFSKQKIVYIEIMTDNKEEGYDFPSFSFDDNNTVVLNTGYIMTGKTEELKQILAILNSTLGRFLVKLYSLQLQKRQFRMLFQYVVKFPIYKELNVEISNILDDIFLKKKKLLSIQQEQTKLDKYIFDLYRLTEQEQLFLKRF